MAFVLDPRQPLAQALRTVALAELDAALAHAGGSRASDVHEARKRCKKLRAWARLLRPQLGAHYALLNGLLRDAARRLSAQRDATVARETLTRLRRGRRLTAAQIAQLGKALEAGGAGTTQCDDRGDARILLAAARVYVAGFDADIDRAALHASLETSRSRCRRGLKAARRTQRVEALHDWRKRVKYYGYQCALVARVFPQMRASAPALKTLGETLGLHHDFHMLCERLERCPPGTLGELLRLRTRELARMKMDRLAADALRQGAQLFE